MRPRPANIARPITAPPAFGAELSSASRSLAGIAKFAGLYALAIVPLAMGATFTRNFDFVKTMQLRGTGVLIIAAVSALLVLSPWLTHKGDSVASGPLPSIPRRDIAPFFAVSAVAIVGSASTLFSFLPWVSFVGGHLRNFGLLTEVALAVIAAAIVVAVRQRGAPAVRHILDVTLVVATAASLHLVAYSFDLDPISAIYGGRDARGPVPGTTFGNTGFYGTFLVFATLAALARARSIGANRNSRGASLSILTGGVLTFAAFIGIAWLGADVYTGWWALPIVGFIPVLFAIAGRVPLPRSWSERADRWVFVGIALSQILIALFARSRSAWIALAVGIIVAVLVLIDHRRVRLTISATVFAFATYTLVALAAVVPSSPIAWMNDAPVLGPVLRLAGGRLSMEGRVQIWRDVLSAVTSDVSGEASASGITNPRALVGYGNGTMLVVLDRFWSFERHEAESARIDRAHNEFLDRLFSTGILGLAAWVALLGVAAGAIMRLLRVAKPDERWIAGFLAGAFAANIVSDMFTPGDPTSRLITWTLVAVAIGYRPGAVDIQTIAASATPARLSLGSRTRQRSRGRAAPSELAVIPVWWRHRAVVSGIGVCAFAWISAFIGIRIGYLSDYGIPYALSAIVSVASIMGLAWLSFDTPPRFGHLDRLALTGFLIVASALFWWAIRPGEADIYNKESIRSVFGDTPAFGVVFARKAVEISPREELYYTTLGSAYGEIAKRAPGGPVTLPVGNRLDQAVRMPIENMARLTGADFIELARASFQRASDLNPYDSVHQANLELLAKIESDIASRPAAAPFSTTPSIFAPRP